MLKKLILILFITQYSLLIADAQVSQQWVRRYDGPAGNGIDYANDIAVDVSGNVYVTGKSAGNGTNYDYATVKYNSSGTLLWAARYDGPAGNGMDVAKSIAVDGAGNVYVTGGSA